MNKGEGVHVAEPKNMYAIPNLKNLKLKKINRICIFM